MADNTVPTRYYPLEEVLAEYDVTPRIYRKIKKRGFGLRETLLPGTRLVRISEDARREWRERLEAFNTSGEAERERLARVEQCRSAGKLSAASPGHPCQKRRSASAVEGA